MSKDEYLITDAPLKALTVFAMPMILGSFFQQVYNMADSIIVGQFVGSSALAAVGACAALTNVFICVALGAGVGAGVLVSRYFGAKNYGKMKTIVSTSLLSFLVLSVVLGVFGFSFSRAIKDIAVVSIDVNITIPYSILNFGKCFIITYDTGISSIFIFISIFNIEINIEIANVKTIVDIIMLICDISFCFFIFFFILFFISGSLEFF